MSIKLSIKSSAVPILLTYLLALLCMVTINAGTNSISQLSYIVMMIILIFSPIEANVVTLFCILPFPRIFLLSSSFFTLVPIIEVIIVVKWLLQGKIRGSKSRQFGLVTLILIYSIVVEYLRFGTFTTSIEYALKLYLIIALGDIINKELVKKAFMIFVLSSIISIIGANIFPVLSSQTNLHISLYSTRFNGLVGNAGEFGQLLVCTVSCAISYTLIKNEINQKTLSIIDILFGSAITIVSVYYMILSGTRTCMVGLAVIYLIVLSWFFSGRSNRAKLLGVLLVIMSLFAGYFLVQSVFDLFLQSHGGEALEADTRLIIWANYFKAFKNDISIILFGAGMDCANKFGALMRIGNPHNIVIEKVVECGVLGLILNGSFFLSVLKERVITIKEKSNLPFYAYFSTLFLYGSVGIEIIYVLLGLMPKKILMYDTNDARVSGN